MLTHMHAHIHTGAAAALVGLPSLLFGRRIFVRNVFVVGATASLGNYAIAHWHNVYSNHNSNRYSRLNNSNNSSSSDSKDK